MPTPEEIREWGALVKRIRTSKWLEKAEDLGLLLDFLAKNTGRALRAKEIEIEHQGFDALDPYHNAARSRGQIMNLRERIGLYNDGTPNEKWICDLVGKHDGYRLVFKPRLPSSARALFWQTHLEMPEDVIVVTGNHLFLMILRQIGQCGTTTSIRTKRIKTKSWRH